MKQGKEEEKAAADGWPWWWRHRSEIVTEPNGRQWLADFDRYMAQSAYMYEFQARLNNRFEFGKPYSQISETHRIELARRWPMEETFHIPALESNTVKEGDRPMMMVKSAESGLCFPKPIKSFSDFLPVRSWNLRMNNGALAREFLRQIEAQRSKYRIHPSRNEGRKNRPLSWLPLELFDIQRWKIRALNDSERGALSKAMRKANRVFK